MEPPSDTQGTSDLDTRGSSTGLDENVAGLLTYLFGFVTGVIFLVVEKDSTFVRFHAFQSTVTFLVLFVVSVIGGWIPLVGSALNLVVTPLSVILWILLMVKAYQGERYQLPVIGEIAEERAQLPTS
jgi:uncharacterized membrane protein